MAKDKGTLPDRFDSLATAVLDAVLTVSDFDPAAIRQAAADRYVSQADLFSEELENAGVKNATLTQADTITSMIVDDSGETAKLIKLDAVRISGKQRKRYYGDSERLEDWVRDTLRSNVTDAVTNADIETQQAAMMAMLRANGLSVAQAESIIASAGFPEPTNDDDGNDDD